MRFRLLVFVAVAFAFIQLSCGTSSPSNPTPTNSPTPNPNPTPTPTPGPGAPPTATISDVTPRGVVLVGGSNVCFGASATGTQPLTYNWSFGSDGTASGSGVCHTFAQEGDVRVVLTVTDPSNRSVVADTIIKTVKLSGTWLIHNANHTDPRANINHAGNGFSGTVNDGLGTTLSGTVGDSGAITVNWRAGNNMQCIPTRTYSGTLNSDFTVASFPGPNCNGWSMEKQ